MPDDFEFHYCQVPINTHVPLRRCFITGEYCSKQRSIQETLKQNYDRNDVQINAFVIMNYDNVPDIMFKWKLKPFIEGLKEFFCISENEQKLRCYRTPEEVQKICNDGTNNWLQVSKINVVRADTTYASNFVVCSRICQQILMADLVVVDVSNNNANVFYELGMAISLGKLVLPVCSHAPFFDRTYPTPIQLEKFENLTINQNDPAQTDMKDTKLEHHIGYFPWRKQLV